MQFGGQTPLKLAAGLAEAGVPLLGTSVEAIDLAEDRGRFGALLGAARLQGAAVRDRALGRRRRCDCAEQVGFPLLVRPSYVLGGRAMEIVYSRDGLADYLRREVAARGRARSSSTASSRTRSRSTSTRCATGSEVWIGGIMQHVEEAGVHSGDSACVLPPHSLGEEMLEQIRARHARDRAGDRRRRADQRAVRRARAASCT